MLPRISLGSPTGNAGLDPELKQVLIDPWLSSSKRTEPVGTAGMVNIVEREVGTFHHGQTLLLSESGRLGMRVGPSMRRHREQQRSDERVTCRHQWPAASRNWCWSVRTFANVRAHCDCLVPCSFLKNDCWVSCFARESGVQSLDFKRGVNNKPEISIK